MPETGKRSQKTAAEFGEAFMTLLGKRSSRVTIQCTSFQETLEKMLRGKGHEGDDQ